MFFPTRAASRVKPLLLDSVEIPPESMQSLRVKMLLRDSVKVPKESMQSSRVKPLLLDSVEIPPESMQSLSHWSKEGAYELIFATKSGLPVPYFPIMHSAIVLRNRDNGTFAVYGRQSPWDVSNWLRDGIRIDTKKDNEKKYLSEGYDFVAYPTGAFFNQGEITRFLNLADEQINKTQLCNMVSSNCYSYSAAAMAFAINALLSKPDFDSEAVTRIMTVIEQHPLKDHFSIGVRNNKIVTGLLISVFTAVRERTAALTDPSEAEKYLLNQTNDLLIRLDPGLESRPPSFPSI